MYDNNENTSPFAPQHGADGDTHTDFSPVSNPAASAQPQRPASTDPFVSPLDAQQRQPDSSGFYHFTPVNEQPFRANEEPASSAPQMKKPKKEKKPHKTLKIIAAGAAVVMLSAAAGGGTALWVLNNNAPANNSTTLNTTTAESVSVAPDGSVAAVAAAAKDSVVEIDTQTRQQSLFLGSSLVEGAGSGVIISEDGYVVTNNHVVDSAEQIIVRLTDGTEYQATLVGTDAQTDLAVLKVDATGLQAVTFADSDQLEVGDLAVAIGNPLGELGGTVTSGIISATSRSVTVDSQTMTLLQTSAAINPGNSGGGLFDSNGHLIGIVNAKSSGVDVEGLGFAIPSNTVQEIVPDIIDNGYVSGRPMIGITVLELDASTAQMYGLSRAGVYVSDPGSNSALQSGDRIVFIDGTAIESNTAISSILREHEVGDILTITVEREGKAVEVKVTLQERTSESNETETMPETRDPGVA